MNLKALVLVGTFALVAATQGVARTAPATQSQPAAEVDPRAERVLRGASEYLAGVRAFRVAEQVTKSMVIKDKPTQRSWGATLAVERPDKFVFRDEGSAGETIVYDGSNVYSYRPGSQRYSVEEATAGGVEKLKRRLATTGTLSSPAVAMLVADRPYEVLRQLPGKIAYVGSETVEGVACDRVRATMLFLNIDMWFRSGQQPLPVKVVRMAGGEGAPREFRDAQMETVSILQDWWLGEDLPEETFRFEPPAGAVKVAREDLVPRPGPLPVVGMMAPAVTLELIGGGQMKLSDHRDRQVVVLAFFDPESAWAGRYLPQEAGAARRSLYLPQVAEVARGFQGEDVRFYVVIPAESRQAMEELLASDPLGLPVALDVKGAVAEKFHVIDNLPMTALIDRQGRIQALDVTTGRGASEQVRQRVRAVLDGKDIAAEAIAAERKELSAQTQEAKDRGPQKQAKEAYGARQLWSLAGWFQDVAAWAKTGEVYALAKEPRVVVLDRGRTLREVAVPEGADRLRLGNLAADDGPEMVLFRMHQPGVTVVDGTGRVLWQHDSGQKVNEVLLADLDGDGLDETIIASSGKPGVEVLGKGGEPLWTLPEAAMEVATGDLDGDGRPEVVTVRRWVRIFDARGKHVRDIKTTPYVASVSVVPSGGGRPAMILAKGLGKKAATVLTCVRPDGQQKWVVDFAGTPFGSIALADDGSWAAMETLPGSLAVVDLATGRVIARIEDVGTRLAATPSEEGGPILLAAWSTGLNAYSIEAGHGER